ncbi:MAG: DNA polymerase III subunit gamma/tau, partial [Clostridia bacterium]|nr:DNA polymerase III subunit gamma/tau [Clostridia bacterium]
RRWRPMVFEDIIGQGHITKTLKNQIIGGKVGHAYLFCGTRGTGKTTCAKVLSRAVNCLNPKDGSPCNECEICKGIIDGSIMDVKEIDAASNNGVDNIREIRDDVQYVSANTKYTVYIIDEVHMLSTGAFNALLKTLEEPPEHVIFILATTEAHKVPETIRSRCQRFDFRRIKPSDIIVRMKEIAHGDGLNITEDAYKMLGRLADGSMRDGLSILERVVSAEGNEVTAESITNVLGISTADSTFKITDAVLKGDAAGIVSVIDDVLSEGKDLKVFMDSLIKCFRDMMLCKVTDKTEAVLDLDPTDMIKLKSLAEKMTFEKLSHAVSVLSDAAAEAKWVKSPRIIYELALIKISRPEFDSSPEALMDRLTSLENKVSAGAVADTSAIDDRLARLEEKVKNGIKVTAGPAEVKEEKPNEDKKVSARLYSPIPEYELTPDHPLVKAARNWDNISRTMIRAAGYLTGVLMNRNITIDKDGVILIFKQGETGTYNIAASYKDKLTQTFRRASGTEYSVKVAYDKELPDDLPDVWSIQAAPESATDEQPENEPEGDPLDALARNFGEIVENADESEFVDYSAEDDNFEQSSFDDNDDDEEEFLEESELNTDDEDDV